MKSAITLLIALAGVALCQVAVAQPCTPAAAVTPAQTRDSFTHESATVEDVVSSVQDGYRSRAYIVTWHGARVLVSDPLARSSQNVGDSIDFIAARHELNGDRILSFISTAHVPHPPAQPPAAAAGSLVGPAGLQGSTTIGTGVIEDVLSLQDGGFRFIAYIVITQEEERVAVSDALALSHHAIGEQIDYLVSRTALPREKLLNFQVQLSAAEKSSIARSLCSKQLPQETGVVDQVLSADADGYAYRAYVIEWRGSQIVIDDPTASTNYQSGDSVSFWVSRMQMPPPLIRENQQFSLEAPVQTTSVNQTADFQTSIEMDSASVQSVLDSTVDGYRSVAYLLKWHGSVIAVDDAFANAPVAAGDRITFSVARTADANHKGLHFMFFRLPAVHCSKPPAPGDPSTTAATAQPAPAACHT